MNFLNPNSCLIQYLKNCYRGLIDSDKHTYTNNNHFVNKLCIMDIKNNYSFSTVAADLSDVLVDSQIEFYESNMKNFR